MTLFSRLTDKSAQLATTDYLLADVGNPPVTGRVLVSAVNALSTGGSPPPPPPPSSPTEYYSARLVMTTASIDMNDNSNALWTATDIHSSTEVEWRDANSDLRFNTEGVYEVTIVTSITVLGGNNFLATASRFSVVLSGAKSPTDNDHYVTIPSSNTNNYSVTTWTSEFVVDATVGKLCSIVVSADCYNGFSRDVSITLRVNVKKVGSGSFV